MKDGINRVLKEQELDALVISDGYNMRYISGFAGATGYLYLTKRRHILLTDSRYTTQAKEEAAAFDVREIASGAEYGQMIGQLIKEDKAQRVGFEDLHMIYADFCELKEHASGAEWVRLGGTVNALRSVKEEWELQRIAKAEQIGDLAFEKILGELKPGVTELSIAAKLDYYMRELGAQGNSFDTIVASGTNSAMPHAVPTEKKLEKGDFVTMDFGCCYQGYCSDMTRTVMIGKADAKQKELYHIVLEAQLAALAELRAGKTGAEVDAVARQIIEKAGYGSYFGHGLGHSVGLFIHEEPRLSPKCREILQSNVPITVEPGIYLPGLYGVRIEDLVVITEDGCKNLASSPKELLEL